MGFIGEMVSHVEGTGVGGCARGQDTRGEEKERDGRSWDKGAMEVAYGGMWCSVRDSRSVVEEGG